MRASVFIVSLLCCGLVAIAGIAMPKQVTEAIQALVSVAHPKALELLGELAADERQGAKVQARAGAAQGRLELALSRARR